MSAENYVRSHSYETYIRFARLCERDEHGARNSFMENLMNDDQGKGVSFLKRKNILKDVKKYMISATKFALKRQLDKTDKEQLIDYLLKIEEAQTSQELLRICDEGIEVLRKYRPNKE